MFRMSGGAVDIAKSALDRRGLMRALVLLVIVAFPLAAFGGISRPDSAVIFSHDGSRMLVMRSPIPNATPRRRPLYLMAGW